MDIEVEDEFLSKHTISMRKALAYCQRLSHRMKYLAPLPLVVVGKNAEEAALTIPSQRQRALVRFWEQQGALLAGHDDSTKGRRTVIPTIDVTSSLPSPINPGPVEFRQRFQHANIPCLIQGLDKTHHFSFVCAQWRSFPNGGSDNTDQSSKGGVNRKWFLEHIGEDNKVPVRCQPSTSQGSRLDDDGRAEECVSKEMTLSEWIWLLDEAQLDASASPNLHKRHHGDYYLKDWHLQSSLRQETRLADSTIRQVRRPTDGCLYRVPPYFQHDLLNGFLTKFSRSGDYMFTYWGPKESKTTLHSDVMNSFSWSFNVAGTKEWTFYPPSSSTDQAESTPHPVVIIQKAGECIFVPCGWKHEVVNLEETLSINHNWITTANIDQTWECMCLEMKAIEAELKAWDIDVDCWDAKESMMRGCVGLDVTAFFLMLLTRILELLLLHPASDESSDGLAEPWEGFEEEEKDWQLHFDLVRLKAALLLLLGLTEDAYASNMNESAELEERLAAVLGARTAANDAVRIAQWATAVIGSAGSTKGSID